MTSTVIFGNSITQGHIILLNQRRPLQLAFRGLRTLPGEPRYALIVHLKAPGAIGTLAVERHVHHADVLHCHALARTLELAPPGRGLHHKLAVAHHHAVDIGRLGEYVNGVDGRVVPGDC